MTERSEQIGGWRGLPFYTRVTISGLLVVALIITSLGILQMVSGGVDIDTIQGIVFYALFMIPTIGVVVLAWRRPDLTIVDGIWAMLVLLILAPSIPNALSTFNSFFDTGLLIPVVVSLIVVGVVGILAFLQHRRGTTRDVATIGERLVLLGTAAVVVGLMILSGTLHLTSLESVSVNEREGAVLVEIENSTFKPAQLAVSAGNPAKFIVAGPAGASNRGPGGTERGGEDAPAVYLPEELADKRALREQVRQAMDDLASQEGLRHINLTDKDARLMKTRHGIVPGYNAQSMVSPTEVDDEASGMLITAVDVVDEPTDYGQFTPMLEQAEETTGTKACMTLADAGYYSGSNLSECAGRGQGVAMPETSQRQSRGHPYHKDRFAYDESSDSFMCPQGRVLPFERIRRAVRCGTAAPPRLDGHLGS